MDLEENETIKNFTHKAHDNREKYFNRSWEEVIGFSDITLTGNYNGVDRNQKSCWSNHLARITRLVGKADIGFQMDNFQGEEIAPGPIRFGDMVDNFPHFRKWGDKGWQITTARIPGFLLKLIVSFLNSPTTPFPLTIDGLEQTSEGTRVAGLPIKLFKLYKIALPSELTFALLKTSSILANLVLLDVQPVKEGFYWPVLEKYIKENSPLRCH
jgi:hypothetical protein